MNANHRDRSIGRKLPRSVQSLRRGQREYTLPQSIYVRADSSSSSMKYRRMKEKFGTTSSNGVKSPAGTKTPGGSNDEEEVEKPTKTRKTPAKKASSKKRKMNDEDDAETDKVKAEEADELV